MINTQRPICMSPRNTIRVIKKKRFRKKVDLYIEKSRYSNVAKSTRRLFFNHLDVSVRERGYFHVDQMYGSGTGLLLRFENTFFLLTARHVIKNNIPGKFQNESPFWVTSKFHSIWGSINDFIFPRVEWNIGELVTENDEFVDMTDLLLIEFFAPDIIPDHFIDIKNEKSVLTRNEFFERQFFLVTGYPFKGNEFDFTPVNEHCSHSTTIYRYTVPGVFIPNTGVGHISFELVDGDVQHEDINGMSGGAVYNVQPKANQVKLAGIPVTAGDNICRFIPSYAFIEAIFNYRASSCRIVDPNAVGGSLEFVGLGPNVLGGTPSK